ncbi:MAG: prepilin-type N-terminal cleavage/methylation domain-containing protein, partial [Planctomycetota bacterium]
MNDASTESGFTLVELLVVIAVIAVLAGLTFAAMRSVRLSSQKKACKATLAGLVAQAETYAEEFGDFPPTSLQRLGIRNNGVNEGIESFVRCMSSRRSGGPFLDVSEDDLQNTDADSFRGTDPTGSIYGSKELFELVDPWGNPLIYFHHNDYRGGRGIERYLFVEQGEQTCQPQPSDKTGQYPKYDTFLIWSAGPDGVN